MKKILIMIVIFTMISTWGFAEHFRLGAAASVELLDKSYDNIVAKFQDQNNLFLGLYWEVIFKYFGFGMTYQAKFDNKISELPGIDNEWLLTWIGSFDFRYHFFRRFFIDPYLSLGIGNAGSIELTDYRHYGYDRSTVQPFLMSIFSEIGCGVTLRLDPIHIGTQLDYRFFNDVPPVTNFKPYPLKNFQCTLFAGFSM